MTTVLVTPDPERAFNAVLPTCVTSFILPHHINKFEEIDFNTDIFKSLPFERFSIRESFTLDRNAHPANTEKFDVPMIVHGVEELVVWRDFDDRVGLVSKTRYFSTDYKLVDGRVYYANGVKKDNDLFSGPVELFSRFMQLLNERTIRFVDQPISRQVRKAQGFSADHREYVVIRKNDVRYPKALNRTAIMRRLMQMHRVRGHLRTNHRTGEKSIVVKPFVRGKGEMVERDYLVKS